MNAVSEDVEKLVEKELEAANERFPQFHSDHEGWAVMQESAQHQYRTHGEERKQRGEQWINEK